MGSQKEIATTEGRGDNSVYKCAKSDSTQGRDTAPDYEEVKSCNHSIVGVETNC